MYVFLDDRFVPAEEATVSVFDRGFLYGDGLFESIRAYAGRLFLWPAHRERLERGVQSLGIRLPLPAEEIQDHTLELLRRNRVPDAFVRVAVSRGAGPRGYSPRGANQPTLVITAHPAPGLDAAPPAPWNLRTSRHRVPAGDPLTSVKTASKLLNVIARAEAEDAGANEALLLNNHGHIAEAAAANIFWFEGGTLCTPGLEQGALAGITRGFVMETACQLGWTLQETARGPEALHASDGVFLTVSTLGLVAVDRLDDLPLRSDARLEILRSSHRDAVLCSLSH